jgi:Na+-transporting NADH:ubiquinone oxidoreductase subunit NqrC
MLEAINILFGDRVDFSGPWNGVVAFFAVVFTILIAEVIVSKIYFALDDTQKTEKA